MSPSASSPFHVTIYELGRRPGLSKTVTTEIPAPADVGSELMRVPENSPIEVDLRLDSVSDGIFVSGSIAAQVTGQCGRCLAELDEDVSADVDELILYPDRREALVAEGDEESADAPIVQDDAVDLEPLVRDALVLALPFQPLCSPDCRGLCDVCGQRWEDLPEDHQHEMLDPRWAALQGLASQPDEDDS